MHSKKQLFLFLLTVIFIVFFPSKSVYAATDCARIEKVEVDVKQVIPFAFFKCITTVDAPHVGSPTIACGISFNGEWPENICPSDSNFAGWKNNQATFNCTFPYATIPESMKTIELVAFDFRYGCGLTAGNHKPLSINTTLPTSPAAAAPGSQAQSILPTSRPTEPVGASTIISQILDKKSPSYSPSLIGFSQNCLKNKNIYVQASNATGVPWQILAGIHYREGECGPTNSLVSGRKIGTNEPDLLGNCSINSLPGKAVPVTGGCGFQTLLNSAIYSGNHLVGKIGAVPSSFPSLVFALSRYNGTGNSNCGKTPFKSCPAYFPGEDDTYVMNFFDARHSPMYIVYCADYTLCLPPVADSRPGVVTISTIISTL